MYKILDNLAPTSFEFHLWPFPKLVLLSVFYSLLSVSDYFVLVHSEICTEIESKHLETFIWQDHFSSNSLVLNFIKALVLEDWKFKKTKQTNNLSPQVLEAEEAPDTPSLTSLTLLLL